ncbi:hypothetical protein [Phaeobacter sp. 22II1-1F12B]|uniref:hypothetical protein n=1 Tax=Phaeobacter sp. 22II1-1F12B TaxID=1317111 RepID=UPI001E39BF69|nr:hypothetical protein [Phaeobacter sp. 22II1-1F12B]
MIRHLVALTCASLILIPEAGQAWRSFNRQEVLPVSEGVFEVVNDVASSAADFWCSAGDYAYREMRTEAVQRVYIWRGIGPSVNRPGKKAVQFSLTPPEGVSTEPGYTLSVKAEGDNMRAGSAQQYCFGNGPEDPGIWHP